MRESKHHTKKSNITYLKIQNHELNSCKTLIILLKFNKMQTKIHHNSCKTLKCTNIHPSFRIRLIKLEEKL